MSLQQSKADLPTGPAERNRRRELSHAIWVGELAAKMQHARIDYHAQFEQAAKAVGATISAENSHDTKRAAV